MLFLHIKEPDAHVPAAPHSMRGLCDRHVSHGAGATVKPCLPRGGWKSFQPPSAPWRWETSGKRRSPGRCLAGSRRLRRFGHEFRRHRQPSGPTSGSIRKPGRFRKAVALPIPARLDLKQTEGGLSWARPRLFSACLMPLHVKQGALECLQFARPEKLAAAHGTAWVDLPGLHIPAQRPY